MDREEILRRAQREGNAEYEAAVYARILRHSVLFLTLVCLLFFLAERLWPGKDAAFAFPAILSAHAAFINLAAHVRLRQRGRLVYALLFTLSFVVFALNYASLL